MDAIRYLIHERLNRVTEAEPVTTLSEGHFDEDTLGAFVESRLREDESAPIVSHLVACGSCRGATARLIRLESFVFAGDEVTIPEESLSRLRQFLESLATQVVPSSDEDAVFAYQNPEDDQKLENDTKLSQNDSPTESTK